LERIPFTLTPKLGRGQQDFHLDMPRLSHEAVKAFFLGSSANLDSLRRADSYYYATLDDTLLARLWRSKAPTESTLRKLQTAFCNRGAAFDSSLCREVTLASRWRFQINDPSLPEEERRAVDLFRQPIRVLSSYSRGEFGEVLKMVHSYQKYASTLLSLPTVPILKRLTQCLSLVPRQEALYGDCLLQEFSMHEMLPSQRAQMLDAGQRFLEWLPELPSTDDQAERFRRSAVVIQDVLRRQPT